MIKDVNEVQDITHLIKPEVDLSGANMSEANMRWDDMRWPNMSGANLSKANMRWDDMSWTGMRDACAEEREEEAEWGNELDVSHQDERPKAGGEQ